MKRRIYAYQQLNHTRVCNSRCHERLELTNRTRPKICAYARNDGLLIFVVSVTVVGVTLHDKKKKRKKIFLEECYPSVEPLSWVQARRTVCSAELSRKRHCPFTSSSGTAGLRFQTPALTDAPLPLVDGSVVSTP